MLHLVTCDFPPAVDGGVASWVADLALALHGTGQAVTVYARSGPGDAAHDRGLPYPVRRLRGRSWGRWQALWAALGVAPRLRRGDQLLFATWPSGALLGPLAARQGVAVGFALHGSELTRLREAPPALVALAEAARARFAVSAFLAVRAEALGFSAQRLPMPLDVRGLAPSPELRPRLACVARLTPLKGVDRALALAAALGWPLDVVGDGPERARLEALAGTLGAEARFWGRLPRAEALERLRGARAAALLSRVDADGTGAEGLGLSLVEAMALGTPTVGSAVGGLPEVSGLVLGDPDDALASAEALRAWLTPARRGEARARALAEHGGERAAQAVLEALT